MFRSPPTVPDGFSRRPLISTPHIEEVVFTCEGEERQPDELDSLTEAIEQIEGHALVTEFGFAPDVLVTRTSRGQLVAMGFETLAVVLAACQAANELATLAGDNEVTNVLGWTGKMPSALKGFGSDNLFRNAGALQARVEEIKAQRFRPAAPSPAPAPKAKVGGIRPRASVQATAAGRPAQTWPVPEGKPPVLFGIELANGHASLRCTCGCGALVLREVARVPSFEVMRERQGSRVQVADLWRHALTPRCASRLGLGRGFSFVETFDRAREAQAEAATRSAPPPPGRSARPPRPGEQPMRRTGKTARKRANKLARLQGK